MAEEDETFDPVSLRFFRADAVMKGADVVAQPALAVETLVKPSCAMPGLGWDGRPPLARVGRKTHPELKKIKRS